MEQKVKEIYQSFNKKRKNYEALKADEQDLQELKELENRLKRKNNE